MTTLYRKRWIELAFMRHRPLSLNLYNHYDEHDTLMLSLFGLTAFITLPKFLRGRELDEQGYGFSFCEDALHCYWGNRVWVFWYPWNFEFYKRWERVVDDRYGCQTEYWVEIPAHMSHGFLATKESHPYTYTLEWGEVQNRTATIYADRMEWRRRCLMWLPLGRLVKTSISVDFDGEVGERSGSWKGGCIGCGYEMLDGESLADCLRRMERERRFK